jgi:hypothetical protein
LYNGVPESSLNNGLVGGQGIAGAKAHPHTQGVRNLLHLGGHGNNQTTGTNNNNIIASQGLNNNIGQQQRVHPMFQNYSYPQQYNRLQYNYPGQYNRQQPFLAPQGIPTQYNSLFGEASAAFRANDTLNNNKYVFFYFDIFSFIS